VPTRARSGTASTTSDGVNYLGSLLFCDDELVLCPFEGPSRAAVKQVSERASIPCERLMDSTWLAPDTSPVNGPQS
jgi:hypothetical protein